MTRNTTTDEEFERYFDDGGDITDFIVEETVERPNLETKKVNVDFTLRQVSELDREAAYSGINRQACIKTLVDEALMQRRERRARLAEAERKLASA